MYALRPHPTCFPTAIQMEIKKFGLLWSFKNIASPSPPLPTRRSWVTVTRSEGAIAQKWCSEMKKRDAEQLKNQYFILL